MLKRYTMTRSRGLGRGAGDVPSSSSTPAALSSYELPRTWRGWSGAEGASGGASASLEGTVSSIVSPEVLAVDRASPAAGGKMRPASGKVRQKINKKNTAGA